MIVVQDNLFVEWVMNLRNSIVFGDACGTDITHFTFNCGIYISRLCIIAMFPSWLIKKCPSLLAFWTLVPSPHSLCPRNNPRFSNSFDVLWGYRWAGFGRLLYVILFLQKELMEWVRNFFIHGPKWSSQNSNEAWKHTYLEDSPSVKFIKLSFYMDKKITI